MRFLSRAKDGGPKSTVTGYWLIELKRLFSVALLRFDDGSRDEYHDHAFNSMNWVLRGRVVEHYLLDPDGESGLKRTKIYYPSFLPVFTRRKRMHRVVSRGTTWVLSFRGPWARTWREFDPNSGALRTLTHGRIEVPLGPTCDT